MSNLKLYCLGYEGCVKFINENAPITSRGWFRDPWGTADGWLVMSFILTPHKKVRKHFMGLHG